MFERIVGMKPAPMRLVCASLPAMSWAPWLRALEIRFASRVFDAEDTTLGGPSGCLAIAASCCVIMSMNLDATEEWQRIRSVPMQIWPACPCQLKGQSQ
jgi:hypothetical protein